MSGSRRSSKKIRAWARENLKKSEDAFDAVQSIPNESFRQTFLARLAEREGLTEREEAAREEEQQIADTGEAPEIAWGVFESTALQRAILVIPYDCLDGGEEMQNLCSTLGIETAAKQLLSRNRTQDPATFVGSGILQKIRGLKEAYRAGAVVFDASLSPGQVRNLEDSLKGPVLDRQGVILEIFKHHAKSKLAKLQVELAHLKYLQPRLSGLWMGLSRQSGGGGVKGRGQGETRLELDRRVVKDRISTLSKKLKEAEKSFTTQSSKRSQFPRVALVGYTNAGKSTIMNRLTQAGVESKDELFHTLDTTVRPLQPLTLPKVLVSDTVGFVRDLPHDLVASFRSTLREALESRLLLIVLDAADVGWKDQYEVTKKVFDEIGGEKIPRLVLMNKIDKAGPWVKFRRNEMRRYFSGDEVVKDIVLVSGLTGEGIPELRKLILEHAGAEEAHWNQVYDGS